MTPELGELHHELRMTTDGFMGMGVHRFVRAGGLTRRAGSLPSEL